MTDPMTIFLEVLRTAPEIPPDVKAAGNTVTDLRERVLDQSYLDFLDEQIQLCPRGNNWNVILTKRRTALSLLVGKRLLDGVVTTSHRSVFIKIDPLGRRLLYWEEQQGK